MTDCDVPVVSPSKGQHAHIEWQSFLCIETMHDRQSNLTGGQQRFSYMPLFEQPMETTVHKLLDP